MTRYLLIFLLLCSSVWSANRTLQTSDLPYNLTSDSAVTYDTFFISGKITSADSGILIGNSAHDFVIYGTSADTLEFGTSTDESYGIRLGVSSGTPAYDFEVVGFTIYFGGSVTDTACDCVRARFAHDFKFKDVNIIAGGENGHCWDDRLRSGTPPSPHIWNCEIDGGRWRNDADCYHSRYVYDGAAGRFDNLYDIADASFEYHIYIHDWVLEQTPGQGLIIHGRSGTDSTVVKIHACSLKGDARNVGGSAANPYLLLCNRIDSGSIIDSNVLLSDTNYGGCRGMLFEKCGGGELFGNWVDVHEGPNAENEWGQVQALRMRWHNRNMNIHDNTFIGRGDNDAGTDSYGSRVYPFRYQTVPEEGNNPDTGITFENNTFQAYAFDSVNDCIGAIFECDSAQSEIIFRNNLIQSSMTILSLGGSNGPCHNMVIDACTLKYYDTTYLPKTWKIGHLTSYMGQGDTARDCVFLNGASDTNMIFGNYEGNDFTLHRTVEVTVNGNNSQIVPGASVWIVNSYNDTVLMGMTDSCGLDSVVATYWWEYHDGADSIGYDDHTVKAKKGTDSSSVTCTVRDSSTASLTLLLTAGDNSGCNNNGGKRFIFTSGEYGGTATRFIVGKK